ncbi:MAG: hypothetical protein RI964_2369 [Pseudomonadota bacterium]|jgi:50S ribosomal protein L16 3-hydroxylase
MMFGNISTETFLRDYWQKKPLLIRQAFPNFKSPITPDELAGLACETDTARIVLEKGGKEPWEVRHGAFDESEFAKLPATHWTLLVNDTDQHLPELKAMLDPFRFIPDWRIDDLMISFAVEGGSVGAHIDAYDVFLIQAQGTRRWQISTQAVDDDNFLPDVELRIIRDFTHEQEWVVEPGDMLYLPPNMPHYGVALDQCMTYSVGFRAPSQADMLENLLESVLEDPCLQQRFSDADRDTPTTNPGELTATDMDKLIDFVIDALPQDTHALQLWLGKYLTTPKANAVLPNVPDEPMRRAELTRLINRKKTFHKALGCRLLYFVADSKTYLFINGEMNTISSDYSNFVQYLCNSQALRYPEYHQFLVNEECIAFFQDLVSSGVFFT